LEESVKKNQHIKESKDEGFWVEFGVVLLGIYFVKISWEAFTSPDVATWPIIVKLLPGIVGGLVVIYQLTRWGSFLKRNVWWENLTGQWRKPMPWPKSPIPCDDVTLVFPDGCEITHSVPRPPYWNRR
jgi:hypothetical protein